MPELLLHVLRSSAPHEEQAPVRVTQIVQGKTADPGARTDFVEQAAGVVDIEDRTRRARKEKCRDRHVLFFEVVPYDRHVIAQLVGQLRRHLHVSCGPALGMVANLALADGLGDSARRR